MKDNVFLILDLKHDVSSHLVNLSLV